MEGTVTHAGGRPAPGVDVVLEVYDGQQLALRREAVADDAGRVAFAEVPAAAGSLARLSARYGVVDFHSEALTIPAGGVLELAVQVAEVTSEGRPLHLDTLHIIIQADEPTLYRVLQFVTVSNAGGAPWAGGPPLADGSPAGLVLPLPETAREVLPAPFPSAAEALPDSMEVQPGRVLDPRPVPPGGRQAALTYELVADDGPVEVILPLLYPTQSVSVLVGGAAAAGLRLDQTNLQQRPSEQIGQDQFDLWTAESLQPGSEVRFRIGPPDGGLPASAYALIGLALGMVLVIAGSLRRPDEGRYRELRADLVRSIAELDRLHRESAIGDAEYHGRRGRSLERLRMLDERIGRGPREQPAADPGSDPRPEG